MVVIVTGCLLEIDPVLLVFANVGIAELEGDPERAGRGEGSIGVERVAQLLLFEAVGQLCGAVCADRKDRESQLRQLGLDLAQLTELR